MKQQIMCMDSVPPCMCEEIPNKVEISPKPVEWVIHPSNQPSNHPSNARPTLADWDAIHRDQAKKRLVHYIRRIKCHLMMNKVVSEIYKDIIGDINMSS